MYSRTVGTIFSVKSGVHVYPWLFGAILNLVGIQDSLVQSIHSHPQAPQQHAGWLGFDHTGPMQPSEPRYTRAVSLGGTPDFGPGVPLIIYIQKH